MVPSLWEVARGLGFGRDEPPYHRSERCSEFHEILTVSLPLPAALRCPLVSLSDVRAGWLIDLLFLNNAAANSWAGVPSRIGLIIVLFRVDHDRGSAVVKD